MSDILKINGETSMPIFQLASIIAALLIGVIVATRNPSDRNRWLLLVFNASISFWIVSYLLADLEGAGLGWNRIVFVAAIGVVFCGYLLVASMAKQLGQITFWVSVLFALYSMIILFTPYVVEDIVPRVNADGQVEGFNVIRGSGYFIYVASLVLAGSTLVGYVFRLSQHATRWFREQMRIIFAGFAGMFIVGLIIGVLLPLALGTSEPANYTFLSAFIVMTAFVYAIARQRLFDIRLAVARSLGYILTLTAIVILYASLAFGVGSLLFQQDDSMAVRMYYIATSLLVALTFNPLRQFFNKLTSRVFLRDTYRTQEVLERLTSFLVRTVELGDLVQGAAKILNNAARVEFLDIVIVGREGKYKDLLKKIQKSKEPTLVADDLASRQDTLAAVLYDMNVALIARLQTRQGIVGYIVCGPKIRGDMLTTQDIDLIRIAAGELAVGVQNAHRFEEILHFNQKLKREVAEATSQLRESNRTLKKLDEAKDEFISMASHQLRTPLTSVKGYISMVLDGDAGRLSQSQQKLLAEAFTASQRMVYLIGDFLNVSRLQTGKFELEYKPTNLAQLVSEEIEQLASTAARRNIAVHFDPPANFPTLRLDENKIRQVIMNFIDNAIFYSHQGGSVNVELMHTGHNVRFEVHDTGIGVPEAERHKLFTKFFRAENARKARPDGTGIGLFMAKKVVAAHGGSITFETKENKGSTFGFVLPLKDQAK